MSSKDLNAYLDDDLEDTLFWNDCWPYGNPGEEALQCGRRPGTYDTEPKPHYDNSENHMSDPAASRQSAQHNHFASEDWSSGYYFNACALPYAFDESAAFPEDRLHHLDCAEYCTVPCHSGISRMSDRKFPFFPSDGLSLSPTTDDNTNPDSALDASFSFSSEFAVHWESNYCVPHPRNVRERRIKHPGVVSGSIDKQPYGRRHRAVAKVSQTKLNAVYNCCCLCCRRLLEPRG